MCPFGREFERPSSFDGVGEVRDARPAPTLRVFFIAVVHITVRVYADAMTDVFRVSGEDHEFPGGWVTTSFFARGVKTFDENRARSVVQVCVAQVVMQVQARMKRS